MRRGGSLEKTLIWEDWGQKEKGMRRLDSITNSVDMDLSKLQDIVEKRAAGMLQSMGFRRVGHNLVTEQSKWVLHWIPAFLLNSRVEGGLGEMVVKCKNSPVIYLNFFTENFLQGKEAWMSLFQSHRGGILQTQWGECLSSIEVGAGGLFHYEMVGLTDAQKKGKQRVMWCVFIKPDFAYTPAEDLVSCF